MKKKKLGIIASAIATSAICASVIAGSTFALFTSSDEVNMTVTAGNVNVVWNVENVNVYRGQVDMESGEATNYALTDEASAAFDTKTKTLTAKDIIAGDKIEFDLGIQNADKNTTASYRYTIEGKSGFALLGDMAWTIDGVLEETAAIRSYASAWITDLKGNQKDTYHVSLVLDGKSEAEGVTASVGFNLFAVQGNAKVDTDAEPVVESFPENAVVYDAATSEDLANALADNDAYVVLAEDVQLEAVQSLASGQNVTIDLNGKNINYGNPKSRAALPDDRPFEVKAGATLTIDNSEENGGITVNAQNVYGIFAVRDGGTLTINGGSYETNGMNHGSIVRGYEGSKIYINGGSYVCTGYDAAVCTEGDECVINGGYYFTNSANDNPYVSGGWSYCVILDCVNSYIKDATVVGIQGGIAVANGNAVIENCTVNVRDPLASQRGDKSFHALYLAGEAGKVTCTVNGGTYTAEYRCALYVANSTPGDGGICETAMVTVNGGTFNGGTVMNCVNVNETLGSLRLNGGTFTSSVGFCNQDAANVIDTETHELLENGNTWTVAAKA